VLTKQWCLDKVLDVARVKVDYEKLLPKQRKAVEAFVCYHVLLSWLTFRVMPHHHMPSTELILLHDPITQGTHTSTTPCR